MIKTAVIMAAGNGSRLKPLTNYVPKPLLEINQKSLINHCIEELKRNGVNNIYVTYGYKQELLIPHISESIAGLINTNGESNAYFIFNTIIKNLNENILILPSDLIFKLEISKIEKEIDKDKSYIIPTPFKKGMDSDHIEHEKDKKIKSITREKKTKYCASGLQIINPFKVNEKIKNANNWYEIWNFLIEDSNLYSTNYTLKEWKTFDTYNQILNEYEKTKNFNKR